MDPIITDPSQQPGASSSDDEPVGATVEERDAYWRKRMGGKDRAHAAAEKALQDQIASYEARLRAASTTGQGGQPGNEGNSSAEIERLQRELEAKDTLYGRKVKYPSLNGNVSDAVISTASEPELARLNALFDDTPPASTGVIAPTQPRRTGPTAGKRIEEMSKDELLIELKRASDREMESRRAGF